MVKSKAYTESPENTAEATYTPAFPVSISPEDVLTEQDKDPSIGPVSEPVEPVKATVLDIKPREPYPSAS